MKWAIFILLCYICSSCNDNKGKSVYRIASLSITAPKNFRMDTGKDIDSYVAYLINTETKDTFHIEYGDQKTIFKLYERLPVVLASEEKQKLITQMGRIPTSDEVLFSEYPQEDTEQRIFDKNYYMYDTINGIIAKIVQPKRSGNGITGMYVPKLKDGNSFSIYAVNLDSSSHIEAIKMFKGIKYK